MGDERAMVMWRVTLHLWVKDHLGEYAATEVYTVEAPENNLKAAASAAIARLRTKAPRPQRCAVVRADVWRVEDTRPVSALVTQNTLWEAMEGQAHGRSA